MIDRLVKENPNCVIVDSGGQSDSVEHIDLIADVLCQLKYDCLGVDLSDLELGEPFFKAMSARKIPILFAGPEPVASTVPYIVRNVDGVRVGVVSFGGVKPPGVNGHTYAVRKALYSAFKSAREESDLLIVLDQATTVARDWLARNARRLGSPDVWISRHAHYSYAQADVYGTTTIAGTVSEGKLVGVVDIEFTPGSAPKIACQLIALNDSIADDAAIVARVNQVLGKPNTETTAVAAQPTTQPPVERSPSPETCKSCHIKQYEDWASSAHARAFDRVAAKNRAKPECLTCHSERYRTTKDAPAAVAAKSGIGCATCHIGSLPHDVERRTVATRIKVDAKSCLECHTPEKSPDYDEKVYFPRVAHTGASVKETASDSTK